VTAVLRLRALKEELRRRRHRSVAELGKWLRSVVQGYFNYHAVPGNLASLRSFRLQVIRRLMCALRRRSQKSRMTWPRLVAIADRWLPKPSILHPYPNLRFDASVDDLSANDSEEFACLLGAQHRHHIQLCKPPCPHPNTHRSNSHKNKNQNGRRCQIHKTRPVYQPLQEPSRKLGRYDP
jgi:hypothetical protein